jgi:ABC-type uncharacterized transport system involved in gliding motility auxiliary subunit
VLLLIYTLSQWREVGRAFQRRQTRMGTLTLASIAIVLGILVAINYIGVRQNKRWDLTANAVFTLSDQTKNVLQKIDAPLKIRVFDKSTEMQRFRDALEEYANVSKRVSVEYLDIDRQLALAKQYQVNALGTVVFEYKGRIERVVGTSEQDLTNGIIKVVTGTQKKIYFVQGHGEKDTVSAERTGYSAVKSSLERENYLVDKLVLIQQGQVPADAAIVVLAGPRTDLLPPEADALKTYLAAGGKLLVLLDPPESTKVPPLANLDGLLHGWGFRIGTNIVVDVSGIGQIFGAGAAMPVAATYPSHPITERFDILTAYPLARSVGPVAGGVDGHTPQTIVETSPRSWADTDIDGIMKGGEVKFDQAKGDEQGPISLAAAVRGDATATTANRGGNDEKKPETRVVVVGDSDFVANGYLNVQGNRDLFMNMIGWLSQQENLISIRPKEPGDSRLTLTADQARRIGWLALVIIPGLIFAFGIYTWWRRR